MRTDHLPFPMPPRSHALVQEWRNLSFLHWEVAPERLAPYIPEGLQLDTFEGKAYVGTIPFIMTNVRPRLAFSVPGISTFPEFNIRTYVTKDGKSGVLFITLDAQSIVTCTYAPWAYGLPYNYCRANVEVEGSTYKWNSKRKTGEGVTGRCTAKGEVREAEKGTLEEFLFERYCLYSVHKGKLCIAHTQHDPWKYREGSVEMTSNSLTESYDLGIKDSLNPDLVHMSEGVLVNTWSAEEV